MMQPFEQLIYDRFAASISAWDTEKHLDIYAIVFYIHTVWSADAAGREVAIQDWIMLGYNTLSYAEKRAAETGSTEKAKWHLGYWPHEYTAYVPEIFEYETDPPLEDFRLRDAWCASLGILPDGVDDGGRPTYGPVLSDAILGACVHVIQTFHQNGFLERKFGKSIPIIIDLHDHNPRSAEATRAANPPGLSREAEEQMLGFTYVQLADYAVLLEELRSRPFYEQVLYWRDALVGLELGQSSEAANRLRSLGRTKYDVFRAFEAIGAAVVPALIPVVEEYSFRLQERLRIPRPLEGSPDIPPYWQATAEGTLTSDSLRKIAQAGTADEPEIECLVVVLKALYQQGIGADRVGNNLYEVAYTLHRLRPDRFPEPIREYRSNKLRNHAEFGLTETTEF